MVVLPVLAANCADDLGQHVRAAFVFRVSVVSMGFIGTPRLILTFNSFNGILPKSSQHKELG